MRKLISVVLTTHSHRNRLYSEEEIFEDNLIRDNFAYFFIKTYVVGAHYKKPML